MGRKYMINNFNNKLAIFLTKNVGTMEMAYVFTLFGILPAILPSTLDIVTNISTSIQLVGLAVIMVGQNLMNTASEKRVNEMYDNIKSDLDLQNQEIAELKEIKIMLLQHIK
jgi:hypothetical protein